MQPLLEKDRLIKPVHSEITYLQEKCKSYAYHHGENTSTVPGKIPSVPYVTLLHIKD